MLRDLPTLDRAIYHAQLDLTQHAVAAGAEHCPDWQDDLVAAERHLAQARKLVAGIVTAKERSERLYGQAAQPLQMVQLDLVEMCHVA